MRSSLRLLPLVFLPFLLAVACRDTTGVDREPPVVRITVPEEGAAFSLSGPADSLLVEGVVVHDAALERIAWSLEGGEEQDVAVEGGSAPGETAFRFSITGVEAGAHTLIVRAYDARGREGEARRSVAVQLRPAAQMEITPDDPVFALNDSLRLEAIVRDAEGEVLTGRTVTWSSSHPDVISVDSTGLLRAVAPGLDRDSVEIQAEADGVTARVVARSLSSPYGWAVTNVSSFMLVGKERRFAVVRNTGAGTGIISEAWHSSDPAVVSVTTEGVAVARAPGTARISVVTVGNTQRITGGKSVTVLASGGYRVSAELGSLGDGPVRPRALNDRGQVVGGGTTGSGNTHAFLWDDGQITDLGSVGDSSSAAAINNDGIVVGTTSTAGGSVQAAIWRPGGQPLLLDGVQEMRSSAVDVNDHGVVAVRVYQETGSFSLRWRDGEVIDTIPEVPGCGSNFVSGINDAGDVVGTTYQFGIFRWRDGNPDCIRIVGVPFVRAGDINNGGDALIGIYEAQGRQRWAGFVWTGATQVHLDGYGGSVYPAGLNERTEVTGTATTIEMEGGQRVNTTRGFFWKEGDMSDLSDLVVGDWTVLEAAGINEAGHIIGTARDGSGRVVAVLLTPVAAQ